MKRLRPEREQDERDIPGVGLGDGQQRDQPGQVDETAPGPLAGP